MNLLKNRIWTSALVSMLIGAFIISINSYAEAGTLQQRFSASDPTSKHRIDHQPWDALLKRFVVRDAEGLNRVDYGRFKREGSQQLKAYLAELQRIDVARLNKNEQFAYWVNLYNAKTIDIVLDHYPVPSIRDIKLSGALDAGPWKGKVVQVTGVPLSLDDIEHQILRPIWRDPRVHYAVNCASVGCPNLLRTAFTGSNLEAMLDKGARDYINSRRGVLVIGSKASASSIYNWFASDFGGSAQGVIAHMRQYAKPELASQLDTIRGFVGYGYDWKLNDIR